jgi:hypothetical protein
MGDPILLLTKANEMVDNTLHEKKLVNKTKLSQQNQYLEQFEDMKFDTKNGPTSMNAVHNSSSLINRTNTERELALKGSYSNYAEPNVTGDNMGYGVTNKFNHINMVPNFKTSSYGASNTKIDSISQRKMELFIGKESTKGPKTENKPLFDPIMNATNIFGMPVNVEYATERYIPSLEKRNQKPFQETRITPGLNLGNNEINPIGNSYRPQVKTIDELRVADKQQITYTTPVVTAGVRGVRRGLIGENKKNKPEKTKEWGTDRHVKNYGYVSAPLIYGKVDQRNLATVNRGTSDIMYFGPAQNDVAQSTPTELREHWEGSLKQNYEEAEPRNAILVEGLSARTDSRKFIPDPTQREQNLSYVNPAKLVDGGKSYMIDRSDVPNPTMRDVHDEYDRSGQAITGNIYKGPAYDPADVQDPTMRDIHAEYDRSGQAITGNLYKGIAYDPSDVSDPTMRNIHAEYDRSGQAITGNVFKTRAYDPSDVSEPTMRNIHAEYDRSGQAITGNVFKTRAYDPSDVSDPTMRNIHAEYDRSGQAITGNIYKGTAYDPSDVSDPTMRDIHAEYDRSGQAITGNVFKTRAYDPSDVSDPTMRNIHSEYDRSGQAITGNVFKTRAYDPLDVSDPTMRDIHAEYDRSGQAITGNVFKTRAYDPLDVPNITRREIHSKLDRANSGANGNSEKSKGYAINYDLMTPDVTRREMHSKLGRANGGANGNSDKSKSYAINYDLMTPDVTRREMHSKLGRANSGANANSDKSKGYAINYELMTPDVTRREMHSKLDRTAGGGESYYEKPTSRLDAQNMVINEAREKIEKRRGPVLSNYSKGPTIDFTAVRSCEKIQINRAALSKTIDLNEKLPFTLTKSPVLRNVENTRIDIHPELSLEGNPYINNMVHKSI